MDKDWIHLRIAHYGFERVYSDPEGGATFGYAMTHGAVDVELLTLFPQGDGGEYVLCIRTAFNHTFGDVITDLAALAGFDVRCATLSPVPAKWHPPRTLRMDCGFDGLTVLRSAIDDYWVSTRTKVCAQLDVSDGMQEIDSVLRELFRPFRSYLDTL